MTCSPGQLTSNGKVHVKISKRKTYRRKPMRLPITIADEFHIFAQQGSPLGEKSPENIPIAGCEGRKWAMLLMKNQMRLIGSENQDLFSASLTL